MITYNYALAPSLLEAFIDKERQSKVLKEREHGTQFIKNNVISRGTFSPQQEHCAHL